MVTMQPVRISLIVRSSSASIVIEDQDERLRAKAFDIIDIFSVDQYSVLSAIVPACNFNFVSVRGFFKASDCKPISIYDACRNNKMMFITSLAVTNINLMNSYAIYPPFILDFKNISLRWSKCNQ